MALTRDDIEGVSSRPGPGARRDELIARLERLPFSRFHFRLGAMLGIGTFFDAFDAISIGVALTVVFTSLHIGLMNAGLLISGGFVGQFIGAWVFGYVSEQYGRKRAFVTAIALFGLFSIATAFAWDFHSLLVLRAVQGLGLGGEVPIASALFNEYMRGPTRGRNALFYETIFIVGGILAPSIGLLTFTLFGNNIGWRVLFLVGGLPALHAIYCWFALPKSARWLADRGRIDEAERIVKSIEAEPRRTPLPAPRPENFAEAKPTRLRELFTGIYLRRTIVLWVQAATTFFVIRIPTIWLPTLYVSIGKLPINDALLLTAISYGVMLVAMASQALVLDFDRPQANVRFWLSHGRPGRRLWRRRGSLVPHDVVAGPVRIRSRHDDRYVDELEH